MEISRSCINFYNVASKLTCEALNCSRKTTFNFVFSSFHFVILDIAGNLIYDRLHNIRVPHQSPLAFILNQHKKFYYFTINIIMMNLKKQKTWGMVKIVLCWMTNTNILATIFHSQLILWAYKNKCIERNISPLCRNTTTLKRYKFLESAWRSVFFFQFGGQ